MGNRRAPIVMALALITVLQFPVFADGGIAKAQAKLKELGYDPGAADGAWGPKTKAAVQQFQRDSGFHVSGDLDAETREKLGISDGHGDPSGSTDNTAEKSQPSKVRGKTAGAKGAEKDPYKLVDPGEISFQVLTKEITFEDGGKKVVGKVELLCEGQNIELVTPDLTEDSFVVTRDYGKVKIEFGSRFDMRVWLTSAQLEKFKRLKRTTTGGKE